MAHKSKADRQREAMERKRESVIPYNISEIREALSFLRDRPHGQWEALHLMHTAERLVGVQMECGTERAMAEGVVRSVLAGGDGTSWLSGPAIADVVQRIVDRARQREVAPGKDA